MGLLLRLGLSGSFVFTLAFVCKSAPAAVAPVYISSRAFQGLPELVLVGPLRVSVGFLGTLSIVPRVPVLC